MDIATFHASRCFARVKSGRIAFFEKGQGPTALLVHGVPSSQIAPTLRRCLLLSPHQTLIRQLLMSALCQKRTF
jgi:hypothetical protein